MSEPLTIVQTFEGYWTGDGDCDCFADSPETRDYKKRQYIELPLLPTKKYRVTLTMVAEEITE